MKHVFFLCCLLLMNNQLLFSAEIKEINPLTNRVILLHFIEGHVDYPNALHVNRLDVKKASEALSYTIVSHDDDDYGTPVTPAETGRKSKGMAFKKDAPWAGGSADPSSKPWASEHWLYLMLDKPLKSGKSYTLNTGNLVTNGDSWEIVFDEKTSRSEAVHVNTLGYAPHAPKYGYVYQWMGDQGNFKLGSYQSNKFYLYKDEDEEPVFTGTLKKRSNADNPETGQTKDTPQQNFLGAEVYECDFSSLSAEGNYKLVVEGIGSSFSFKIGEDPVWEAYYHGARSLYHQRSGIRLAPPYAQDGYIRPVNQNTKVTSDDGTDFSGKLLYCTLPWVEWEQGETGGSSQAAIRAASIGNQIDVAGWYHDAGDWDGYFSHQRVPVLLMLTYEAFPQRFMDGDLNIPESSNGIPDIVDEASWLVKFNYRLRKELIAKGFSNGGVGGARIAPDFFTAVDGSAESQVPSWKEFRRTVVTNADAYMTYLYAGQAAQLAYILKTLAKNPESFPVELLDHVEFEKMSYDTVNWIREAEEAYAWASSPENQPSKHAHYSSELWVYQMYAAAALYRLTDKEEYHNEALSLLDKVKAKSRLEEDERYGVYTYLMSNNDDVDPLLQDALKTLAKMNARIFATDAAEKRGLRWGGLFDFPMLVGQATTPWMFEAMMAFAVTGDQQFSNVVHTTADYFLGSNPLHTTWMTGVGPRPARGGFHLDTRYLWDNNWMTYPGFVPYGPWSMEYGYEPYKWTIDGVEMEGGQGTWNKDWANFSMYPLMNEWPGHERYNNNIHAPMSTENTIHQQSVYLFMAYGFVNNSNHSNKEAPVKIGSIQLNQSNLHFTKKGEQIILNATIDEEMASFPAIKWSSSDQRIAHVDAFGRVTAITKGQAVITVSTLDESVSTSINVQCNWEEINVESISVSPKEIEMVVGQKKKIEVRFNPENASNKFIDWLFTSDGIVEIDQNNILNAIAPGNTSAIAISLNSQKRDTLNVVVIEATDHIMADFDTVIPVTTAPQPDKAQLYTPEGTNDVAFDNPLVNEANPSAKV
ncbi:MAG: glycoside hydrolase family 9 protein, partial [Prolixibacteraceae bacterium]|nr:glycoside hydrolase family 9 protein [Prolixibacteraceae bacterium]